MKMVKDDFINDIKAMRRHQRDYFRHRNKNDLISAKYFEAKVDEQLRKIK